MKNFNWTNFDSSFLKSVIYSKNTEEQLRPVYETDDSDVLFTSMQSICISPDREFVEKYRAEIEEHFLSRNPDVVIKVAGDDDSDNYRTILYNWQRSKMTASLVDLYIKALYMVGYSEYAANYYSAFTNIRTVDLEGTQQINEIPLESFQEDAVKALKTHFISRHCKSGLLVMPTGSGKTRTSVAFLLQYMIPKGYQIVWLTHRHELIDQSASAFYKFSPVISNFSKEIKSFKMVCVSGKHQTMKATEKEDNLMILSVQSVCRNLDFLDGAIADKVIIVVDEAHHTVAPSYRKVIDRIRRITPDAKLLGLTATPVRSTESESKFLFELYDNKLIYEVYMDELITKGFLAKPIFDSVDTGQNFEPTISIDEEKHIKKWGELPPSLVDRVARSSMRNEVIVKKYLENKELYGKTIIFALNGFHAFTLCETLKKSGVKCDFVYTSKSSKENESVINRFKNNEIDVLININILTEGTDIPDIETVFLTRPTSSEVLLMQMIGRGMRGVESGGTKDVTIVDFCDKWDVFNKWLHPELVLSAQSSAPLDGRRCVSAEITMIPWGVIRDIYNSISFNSNEGISYRSVPFGWYELLDGEEEYKLIVLEDQYECYERIVDNRDELRQSGNLSVKGLKKFYFSNFVFCPSDRELQVFVDNLLDGNDLPVFFRFDQREQIEPYFVAQKILDEKLDTMEFATTVYNNYPVAQGIFGSVEKYRQAVFNCINYGMKKPDGFAVKEIPLERIPFRIDKPYDINVLSKEVVDEMFGGVYEGINSIAWTEKPLSSYYGKHYPNNDIRINVILNSTKVPREAVKYVIYHEMLHRDYHDHGRAFKVAEHRYPNYTEWERFLDYKFGEFEFVR